MVIVFMGSMDHFPPALYKQNITAVCDVQSYFCSVLPNEKKFGSEPGLWANCNLGLAGR
jgi:hypothetical protein